MMINSVWKKFWLGYVRERDFKGSSSADPTHVVKSIVNFWKSIGFKVSGADVEDFVDERSEELTTENLQNQHLEIQKAVAEEVASYAPQERMRLHQR